MTHQLPMRPDGTLDRLATINLVEQLLVEQGRPSTLPNGSCRYRGEGGTKCAIGMFLSDEDAERHEGQSPMALEMKPIFGHLGHCDLILLRDLQNCHDTASKNPRDFVANLKLGLQELRYQLSSCILQRRPREGGEWENRTVPMRLDAVESQMRAAKLEDTTSYWEYRIDVC